MSSSCLYWNLFHWSLSLQRALDKLLVRHYKHNCFFLPTSLSLLNWYTPKRKFCWIGHEAYFKVLTDSSFAPLFMFPTKFGFSSFCLGSLFQLALIHLMSRSANELQLRWRLWVRWRVRLWAEDPPNKLVTYQ